MSIRFIITYIAIRHLETLDYISFIELCKAVKVDCSYKCVISESIAIRILEDLVRSDQTKILKFLLKNPEWRELYSAFVFRDTI